MHKGNEITMKKSTCTVIKVFLAAYWSSVLLRADSYYVPYMAVAMFGCACMAFNHAKSVNIGAKRDKVITYLYAGVLALCVAAANYSIYDEITALYSQHISRFIGVFRALSMCLVFLGGVVLFREILCAVYYLAIAPIAEKKEARKAVIKPWVVLCTAWVLIAMLDLIVLFGAEYPGNVTPDSVKQIHQIFQLEPYSNHHPYYHTQIIKLFIMLGMKLFGDVNVAVATYNVFSVLMLSGCFAYSVCTVYQINGSIKAALCVFLFYFLMPYNIKYSYTVWKDVLFAAAVLLFVLGVFRTIERVGKSAGVNTFMMLAGAFGMTLLRSNGFLAFFLSTAVFALLFFKNNKKEVFMFAGVLLISFIMKYPVLNALNVAQPDTIEALSIPVQQIARVISDDMPLADEQRTLLDKVVDVDRIPAEYESHISDPIKELVRETGDQKYLSENKAAFLKLYVELGLKYPKEYVRAWIDQTRGYWNAGYNYWVWVDGITENAVGMERTLYSPGVSGLSNEYFRKFYVSTENPLMLLFVSVGFNVWLVALASYSSIMRKNRAALFTAVPSLMIIATLLVATPVFCEFRYAYALFCCLPFILYVSFERKT